MLHGVKCLGYWRLYGYESTWKGDRINSFWELHSLCGAVPLPVRPVRFFTTQEQILYKQLHSFLHPLSESEVQHARGQGLTCHKKWRFLFSNSIILAHKIHPSHRSDMLLWCRPFWNLKGSFGSRPVRIICGLLSSRQAKHCLLKGPSRFHPYPSPITSCSLCRGVTHALHHYYSAHVHSRLWGSAPHTSRPCLGHCNKLKSALIQCFTDFR